MCQFFRYLFNLFLLDSAFVLIYLLTYYPSFYSIYSFISNYLPQKSFIIFQHGYQKIGITDISQATLVRWLHSHDCYSRTFYRSLPLWNGRSYTTFHPHRPSSYSASTIAGLYILITHQLCGLDTAILAPRRHHL